MVVIGGISSPELDGILWSDSGASSGIGWILFSGTGIIVWPDLGETQELLGFQALVLGSSHGQGDLSWPWFGGQVKARVRFLGPFYPIASLLYFGIISFSFNSKIQHTTLPILTWTILMKTLSTEFEESLVCWLCIFLSRCWCHYRCYKSANEHRCLQREFESTDSLSFISKIYTFVMWDSPLYAVNTIG